MATMKKTLPANNIKLHKQKILFWLGICILILLIAGGSLFFNQSLYPQAREILNQAQHNQQSIAISQAALYAPDSYRKASLFLEKATAAFSKKNYINALPLAKRSIEEFNKAIHKIQHETAEKMNLGFEKLFVKGEECLKKGNYDLAGEYFNLALKLNPRHAQLKKKADLTNQKNNIHKGTGQYSGMIYIPAGEFTMGSGRGDADERLLHKVYLSGYYIDKYEVTFSQYDKFCEATGRGKPDDNGWGRENRPVINVSWKDAEAYAKWSGKRLPTEAEWEKAARAGSEAEYCFGNAESKLGEYAWYKSNSGGKTHPVGQKKPNQWGIYDMHGNVWEWCSDWYEGGYYKNSPYKNPQGPDSGIARVLRGGSWMSWVERRHYAYPSRSANRYADIPKARYADYGFRCVKD